MAIYSPKLASRPFFGWSASHWLHFGFALGALALYLIGSGAQTKISGLPPEYPLDQLTYPLEVGSYTVQSEPEFLARIAGQPIGQPVRLRSLDGSIDTSVSTVRLYTQMHIIVTRINGIFFFAVSLIVFAPRIQKIPARDLFWACLLYGLAIMIGGIYQPQIRVWPGVILPLARIISLITLPILMLNIGLTFPDRAPVLRRHSKLMPTVILIGMAIGAWQFCSWTLWFNGTGAWNHITFPHRFAGFFLAAIWGWGVVGLILGSRRSNQQRVREQVKWLLWGIAMGAVPYIFLHVVPQALDQPPVISLLFARLFSIIIPIAFSMAVIRHKFLDVDIIIRRSLLYITLSSLMVGIYAIIGIGLGQRVEEQWPQTALFVPIIATLIAVMLFSPTHRALAHLIDRLFFKIRYNHSQALTLFRQELRQVRDQQQVADHLAAFLAKHLDPAQGTIVLEHQDEIFVAHCNPQAHPLENLLPDKIILVALAGMTCNRDLETGTFPPAWQEQGFVMGCSISGGGHQLGYLALGEKRSDRCYVQEDLELLATATREVALSTHRLNLEQDFIEETVARHRIEEMNRFRTQFFAQFAHDLRSPLTSINWGSQNLLDGVVGELNDDQKFYLEGIENSAQQLVSLVNNLLEATRLETGTPEVVFSAQDLNAVVERSLSKLIPTASAKGLTLKKRGPENAPIWGNGEKLLEVLDNLIENAIRFAPPGSQICITLETTDQFSRLAIEDEGPGLDPKELEAIFEPYRQGPRSPHSTQQGFGLGLFIVKTWTEKMGGQVQAQNRPSGGACFTLTLPTSAEDNPEVPS